MLRIFSFCAVAALCMTASCKAHVPNTEAAEAEEAQSVSAEWQTCSEDADCVLVSHNCCACMSGDYTAVNREYRAETREAIDPDDCESCPAMDCPPVDPYCREGLCISAERGYAPEPTSQASSPDVGRTENGFFVTDTSPDPLACTADTDCRGDTVLGADGCCRDPYSLRPHSQAYSRWQGARSNSAVCASVECPPPPNPAPPADCYFAGSCEASGCVNSCPTTTP